VDIRPLLLANARKTLKTIGLVEASIADYRDFDPAREYTPKELEPYDALADRFVRAVECALRYFRSVELDRFAETSDSARSLLDRMEKLDLVSSTAQWMAMRNVRNRIVHDYLPEQTAALLAQIASEYAPELNRLRTRMEADPELSAMYAP
jgi:hypothetical protein